MKLITAYIFFQFILCNQDTLILVSDKVITKNDFIRRAEYTVRPSYCKSNEEIDKKIILNSLIAEKLFSIENLENKAVNNKISNFITGIKEQNMRKLMLEEYVNKNLHIEENLINNLYNQSQFEYEINFITFKSNQIKVDDIQKSFEEISEKINVVPSSKDITFFTCSNNTLWDLFYNQNTIHERHRHRYEVNNKYINTLEKNGLIISGKNTKLNLVEIIEFKNHPWFIASQFHPELKSRILKTHPLFSGFIESAIKYSNGKL